MKLIHQTADAAQFEPYVAGWVFLHSNLAFITCIQCNEISFLSFIYFSILLFILFNLPPPLLLYKKYLHMYFLHNRRT